MANWLKELSDEARERVFEEMRRLGERADTLMAQHRRLAPQNGSIPVGGAHIDPLAQAEGLYAFLRAVRKGETPTAALASAKAEARLTLQTWNSRRKDHQVHRWVEGADSYILDAVRPVLNIQSSEPSDAVQAVV